MFKAANGFRLQIIFALAGAAMLPSLAILNIGSAYAQAPVSAEKDAFEAAKELGTVEAWDAFLSNYPTGFHADLARAYVKKLADTPSQPPSAAPVQSSAVTYPHPEPAGSWGGIVRDGPGQDFRKVTTLDEGEPVRLLERTDVIFGGFPWFKISFRDGETGYKWGGILCSVGAERQDIFKTCPEKQSSREPEREPREVKRTSSSTKPKGCGKSSIMIDGRCVKKRDAATHCGPGYRLKGNTCVQGYQEPKPQKQLPSWQIEAIKKGCAKGMGWNAQEGCHHND